MTSLARTRRSIVKPVAFGLGGLILAIALLIVVWMLWILLLRPAPAGFAPTTGQAVQAAGLPSDIAQYTIDARSRKDWVYFSFAQGASVSASQEDLGWDLAFRRTDILTNSGDTNPMGSGGAVDLGDIALANAVAPTVGFTTDATHEERGLENPTLHSWYNYNWTTHIITSKNHTYALRTSTGEVVLLTFVSYYCEDGSAACVTFRYKSLEEH